MSKIKITEEQLQFVLKHLISEQTTPAESTEEPVAAPSNIPESKSFRAIIGQTINLMSGATKRRPQGINWGEYKIISAQPGEDGVIVFMVQEITEEGKNRWGQLQLIYDPQSPDDLFLKNDTDNLGKIVICKPLTDYIKQNQPS